MEMLNLRNELSHDYDGSLARESFATITGEYIPLFQRFCEEAGKFMEQEADE